MKETIKKVLELSKVPTIGHLEGLCHIYLDNQYNYDTAEKLIINSTGLEIEIYHHLRLDAYF